MQSAARTSSILLADDDPAVRRFLCRVLEKAGYSVTEAADGGEATEELGRQPFDLLIIDLSMPGQDGWETIRSIRSENDDLKILAISGFFTAEYLTMAKYLGADATLEKPIGPDALLQTVGSLMEGSASRATVG